MIFTLRLEVIGDNLAAASKGPLHRVLRQVQRLPQEQRGRLLSPGAQPWVAEITGLDARRGLARTFLRGFKDYRGANSTGSRGIFLTFVLYERKLYEVNELQSWTRMRRFFCEVVAGKLVELTAEQVAERLSAATDAIQRVVNAAAERL